MCGLVGMYTSRKNGFLKSDADELFHLLLLNSVRGSHSTGLMGVDMRYLEQNPDIVKVFGNPYNFHNFEDYGTFNKRFVSDYTLVLGHGRYATQGAINALNAHPFKEGHITLVHNGTIHNFKSLQKEKGLENIDVDSRLVCKLFETEGVEKAVAQLDGAYAFMWYDANGATFNVLRNYARPLFYGKYQNNDTLVFASERETLEWNAKRNRTPLSEIHEVPVNTMLTWDGITIEPERKHIEPKKYIAPQNTHTGGMALLENIGGRNQKTFYLNNFSDGDFKLEKGQRINVDLLDFTPQGPSSHFDLFGGIDGYPEFIFTGRKYNITENDLYECDGISGEISTINHILHNGKSTYKVVLISIGLRSRSKEDDNFYILKDAVDDHALPHKIAKWRALEIAESQGCGWCMEAIDGGLLRTQPSLFRWWDNTQTVICPSCAIKPPVSSTCN